MTLRKRRILFFISIVFFLILTPILVEYSRGFRFNFKTWQFVETGGFFFRIHSPTEAQISLDDKSVKTTSAFSYFNNAFIQNLTPGTYNVKISKDNYQDWRKILKIEPQLVTEAQDIVLIPEDLELKLYNKPTQKIKDFYWSPSKKSLALIKYNEKNQTILGILNLDSRNETEILISKNIITLNLQDWREDNNRIVFHSKNEGDFIIINVIDGKVQNLDAILPPQISIKDITDIKLGSQDNIFILKDSYLYMFNTSLRLLMFLKKNIASIEPANGDSIYYITKPDFLFTKSFLKDKSLISEEILGTIKFKLGEDITPKINILNSGHIFIDEATTGLLLKFLSQNNSFLEIDGDVTKFYLSDDEKKILYQKKNDLMVYYLEDIKIQPYKYANQKEVVLNIPQEIISSQWFETNKHVFYSFGDSIKFIELDNRDNQNIAHIIDSSSPDIFYDGINEMLYILSNENMYTINFSAI
ncbi:MAG: hypothetical protein US78_C0001G0097 [Parcubacteria group bacterium GW2011_GWD1_38_16]|nr:MAG: hypothetical protein US78_C0001G0097 [Parcubacteria group bacterium GW2011_GWD1_38_16]